MTSTDGVLIAKGADCTRLLKHRRFIINVRNFNYVIQSYLEVCRKRFALSLINILILAPAVLIIESRIDY